MNLAAYLRVSTEAQASDGLGLEVQEHAIRSWADSEGHRIVSTHTDTVSGALEERNALGDVLAALRQARADGVVVYRLDRLARELVIQEQLIREVESYGRRVFSTISEEDRLLDSAEGDPSRMMIRQILGAVSQYERAMIRLRMQSGAARKRASGGYAGGGVPYGWMIVNGEMVEYEPEQAQRSIILAMRQAGASYRTIAATLSGSGAPPPKGGKTWHAMTIRRIAEHEREKVRPDGRS